MIIGVKWFGTLDINCEFGGGSLNLISGIYSRSCPSAGSEYKYKHIFARISLHPILLGRGFVWLCRLFNIIMQQVCRLLLRRTAWTEKSILPLDPDHRWFTTFASRFELFRGASRPWPWDIRDILDGTGRWSADLDPELKMSWACCVRLCWTIVQTGPGRMWCETPFALSYAVQLLCNSLVEST